ncbi:uncharacterized protein DUF4405 [Maribacter spongiicola]|uniref:Uncharacterized protein DUF4405 n=1 Tax=Maribacter spongiicola TaxID=1206753 RepID=A0A4V3ERC6_9FLAO|nr:DUF4405 domain-containing protein [Maribacter spongiicola]TDT45208.1 uncharacterized protein DUF4405 [Maribacter spongiicola]
MSKDLEMNEVKKPKKASKVRILVDLLFFILMILVLVPQSTGIPIHEWASFIIIIPFFIHVIINWNWITVNSRKFFKKEVNKTRFDYVLNWLLYILMITVTVSGIVISEAALPVFGIHFIPDAFWSTIHNISATLFMVVLGIHITLHWKWILGAFRKLKLKADLHNLTGVGAIIKTYSRDLIFLITITTLLSFAVWLLNFTDWADSFRVESNTENSGQPNSRASWMMYVLPLVKVTVLIGIPALISGGIIRLKKKLVKK